MDNKLSNTSTPSHAATVSAAPTEALGQKSIGSLLAQYSIPAIFPLMNLVAAFCMMIAAGGATITSIFLGQKNMSRATDVVNNVFVLCLIHAFVVGGITLIFLDDILYFFGATDETIVYAREFKRLILLGTPIAFVFIGLNNLMRATGYPKKAMISALISVAVNVVLAPLFIFSFKWGIRGAACATLCGQTVAFIWVLCHFLSRSSIVHFKLRNRWLSASIVKRIYAIGLSPFLMNVCACVVVIFINRALLDYGGDQGNLCVGAYGIINRTTMFFVMVVFGVTQGMQPILGYNIGSGQHDRVKRTLRTGIWIGVAITSIGWMISEGLPDTVSHLFTTDETLTTISREGFRVYFIVYPVVGCQIVIQNFFQSVGKPKLSIFLSLTRQLLFLLPFLIFLPRLWGITGVWAAMAASDFIAFLTAIITLSWWMKHKFRKLNT